jgi:hypothetical protein
MQQRPVLIGISSAASSRIVVSELQYDLNNRFGSNAVKLIAETTPDDSWFAFLDLESRVEAFEHRRTQPAQQPDRTIIVQATGDAAEVTIRQTIVDLCAGALG